MTTFISADWHLNHSRIIDYCKRPFTDVKHMNSTIINNTNNTVDRNDTLYYLGDWCFGTASDIEYYRSQINCQNIHFILGNHDDKIRNLASLRRLFLTVSDIGYLKLSRKRSVVLCHYAMRTWRGKNQNWVHLYGHSHGKLNNVGLSMDVGIDGSNFVPWNLDNILKIMKNRSDRF